MRIVSIESKLLKTVGLLAVRFDLNKLQLKNHIKKTIFLAKILILFYRPKISVFWLP